MQGCAAPRFEYPAGGIRDAGVVQEHECGASASSVPREVLKILENPEAITIVDITDPELPDAEQVLRVHLQQEVRSKK